jgi:hypothetical protein
MANFCGCLLSTSFRVKDRVAFLADPEVAVIGGQEEGFFNEDVDGYFSFGWYNDCPSILLTLYDDNLPDGERDFAIVETIRLHILPGDVCQIGVSGNEKLRYVGCCVWWVTSKGVIGINGETEWESKLTERSIRRVVDELAKQAEDIGLRTKATGEHA